MNFTDEQIALLKTNLDPKHVKKPSGNFGPKGDYLEGWHVINEANRIFGFGGWSYTIELTRDAVEKDKDKNQWQAAYTCVATVTVGAVVRQDVGFGSGFAKQIGDAIEGATKEAATDALKRALRTFGNQFGLALYDKQRSNVSAPPAPTLSDAQRDDIAAMVQASGTDLQTVCDSYGVKSLKDIAADKFDNLKNRLQATIDKNSKQQKVA